MAWPELQSHVCAKVCNLHASLVPAALENLLRGFVMCMTLLRCLQLVMLGSGHPPYEAAMREQEERHPQHFRGWVGFSIPVAHRIVAGALFDAVHPLRQPTSASAVPWL